MFGAASEPAVSDFHLVESADGWLLTINLTRRVLDAFVQDGNTDRDEIESSAGFTVHIEPNLVPGEPFKARVLITRPAVPS